MTELSIEPAIAPTVPAAAEDWQALPPAAAQLAMASGLLWGLACSISIIVFVAWPLRTAWPALSLLASLAWLLALLLAGMVAGVWRGYRHWKFSLWKLDDTGLHVRRGRFWRKEILIPRSRVQHLDIERGPIERHFGLATLIVHTAGTRQHALRQSGFVDADAVALRDALVPASDRHDDVL